MTRPGLLTADIIGVSVWGPGLEGWAASRAVLSGAQPYEHRASPAPPPALLASTERRRTGPVVRLALAVAGEAATASGLPPADLRSVFGTGNGDGVVVGGILDALSQARDERVVSPTAFHNSVHNAAAGYWSIATGGRAPASCLGAYDDTWPASLLAAMVDGHATGKPVLLCCYDHPLPPPLHAQRPTSDPFGAGLVLAPPGRAGRVARLHLAYGSRPAPGTPPRTASLHALFTGNPIGRALPLLEALARGATEEQAVPYLDGHLWLRVEP